jgi:hypothetical protein
VYAYAVGVLLFLAHGTSIVLPGFGILA